MVAIRSTNDTAREEPMAPPFWYQDIILATAASIYAGGGFGNKFCTEAAFLSAVLLLLVRFRRLMIPLMGVIVMTCILLPSLMQSPFLLAAILLQGKRPSHAILVLFGSALQLLGGFNPFYLPLILLPMGILSLFHTWAGECRSFKAVAFTLLIVNIAPAIIPLKAPEAHQGFAFPYRVDIAKMAGVSNPGTTYSSIDDHGDLVNSEVLVLEHDPAHGLAKFNWSQQRLWPQNQYYGSVLLRIAAGLDGYLYSNLGCRVENSGLRLLGEAHRSEYNSFISKSSGKLIFSDSDFLNNGAIGYQEHLTDALFRRFSYAHSILFGTAICFLLSLWNCTKTAAMILLATISIATCVALKNHKIDIRIIDDRAPWPHSQGIGGIASEVNAEQGILTVGRIGRARILGIARDATATQKNEKVIVMEGGSIVNIGSATFEALDYPLGKADGITDAIPIREIGSKDLGKCIQKTGNTILIGTNSARLNWKTIYDASK